MMAVALLPVLLEQSPVPPLALPGVPPVPPLPRSGNFTCQLQDEAKQTFEVEADLGFSALKSWGRRIPQVKMLSSEVPEFAGTYEAKWLSEGGDLTKVSDDGSSVVALRLLTPTYLSGKGAVIAERRDSQNLRRFYSGFCETSFSAHDGTESK